MITKQYIYNAKVLKVIDGDTLDVAIDLGFDIFHNVRLRLLGINTHELRDPDPEKKLLGQQAKRRVEDLLNGKTVLLETKKTDKYGRYLAIVYLDQVNINQQLVNEGLAVVYNP